MRNAGPTVAQIDRLHTELAEIESLRDELVAEHDGGSLDQFDRYADDPLGFLVDVCGATLVDYQRDVVEAVRENPRVVIRSAHGMGKDFLMARLMLWHVYARRGLAIYTAPTDRQLGIGMKEVRAVFRENKALPGSLYTRSLRIDGDDRLMAFTSTNVDNLTGWHSPQGVMVAISEGQGERVEDVAYDAAFACTTEAGSRLIVGGNPVRPLGRFHEINEKDGWHAIALPASRHPNVAAGRQVVPWGPGPDWPDIMAREWGRDSPQYTARVTAQFPSVSEFSLIAPELVDDAERRGRQVAARDLYGRPVRLGLDVARSGSDSNALAVVHDGFLRPFRRVKAHEVVDAVARGYSPVFRSEDLMQTAGLVHRVMAGVQGNAPGWQLYHGCRRPVVAVDVVGLGSGVYDRLREMGAPARAFNSSQAARRSDKYANARAEAYWNLRTSLEDGDASFVGESPELREELVSTEYYTDSRGRIAIVGKDEIKRALKRSPDLADSLAIAVYGGGGRPAEAWVVKYN